MGHRKLKRTLGWKFWYQNFSGNKSRSITQHRGQLLLAEMRRASSVDSKGSLCVRTSSSCAATELFKTFENSRRQETCRVDEERESAAMRKVAHAWESREQSESARWPTTIAIFLREETFCATEQSQLRSLLANLKELEEPEKWAAATSHGRLMTDFEHWALCSERPESWRRQWRSFRHFGWGQTMLERATAYFFSISSWLWCESDNFLLAMSTWTALQARFGLLLVGLRKMNLAKLVHDIVSVWCSDGSCTACWSVCKDIVVKSFISQIWSWKPKQRWKEARKQCCWTLWNHQKTFRGVGTRYKWKCETVSSRNISNSVHFFW